jgi:hypothetical protein
VVLVPPKLLLAFISQIALLMDSHVRLLKTTRVLVFVENVFREAQLAKKECAMLQEHANYKHALKVQIVLLECADLLILFLLSLSNFIVVQIQMAVVFQILTSALITAFVQSIVMLLVLAHN